MSPVIDARFNSELFGHSAAEGLLHRCAVGNRLHHAVMFTGPEGIGKSTLAYRFARALLADLPGTGLELDVCHPVFRQVAVGSHPDMVTIGVGWDEKKRRERKEIVLDDTERLFDLFSLTPASGGWRIVLIDGVDNLNRNAANALLKLIEEPPRRAIFLLTTSAPSRLPTTLRSRCLRLALRPLNEQDMALALRHCGGDLDEAMVGELTRLGRGSPGKALRLADRQGHGPVSFNDLAGSIDPASSTSPGEVRATIHKLLREAMTCQSSERPEPFSRPVSGWCEAWSMLGRSGDTTTNFNLDLDQLIFDMAQIVRNG